MKKTRILLAAIACLCLSAACTDRRDSDTDTKKQNVYVKYRLDVGTALASLYDIEVTYCDIGGKEYTEDFKFRRTGNKWEYKEEAGSDANIHFKFVATARLRENYQLEDDEYNLSHTFSVNWYEKATKAMSYSPIDQQVENLIVSKADIEEYLEKHPVITIVNIVERPNP